MRVSHSQMNLCKENPTIMSPNEFRQTSSTADGFAVRGPEKRKVHFLQKRQRYTDGDKNQGIIGDSFIYQSSQPSYRSCIHLEVPLRSASSVVFLDKSLSISLGEINAAQPSLYRSTLSLRLSVASYRKSSRNIKPAKTDEDNRRSKVATLSSKKCNDRETGSGNCRSLLSKQWGRKVQQVAQVHGVNSKVDDSDTRCHGSTLGLLSFREPSPSNTKAGSQKGNADEAACPTKSNFSHRQRTFNIGPVESSRGAREASSDKTEERRESGSSRVAEKVTADKTCHYRSRLEADSLHGTPKPLSLKEALELFRPDFISRSQRRVRRLEQRARRRRALQDSNPDLVQGLREDRGSPRRNCTTPDPLSDNLFKPRERSISGREMQLRSRRIYNKLPEVTKKKEEEKKRAVSETNRLRAEVFKKRLLDQILQR